MFTTDPPCEEHTWRYLPDYPNAMECRRCGQWRDLAPQHHLYYLLRDRDRIRRKIDAGITAQVQWAWQNGVTTTGGCQGGCFTTAGPTSAVIEFQNKHLEIMRESFSELAGAHFQSSGPIGFMFFPAPERCPMWDVEAELGEAANTRPYTI